MWRILILAFLPFWLGIAASAQSERRLALVLANQDYPPEIGRLTNTHEDADEIEAALRDTGFTVTKILDADADGLEAAITSFELAIDREAADGDKVVAFVYASMHGASADVNGRTRNFWIPAKEEIASPGQLIRKGVRMDQLIAGLGASSAEAIFIVSDACRNSIRTRFSKSANKGFVPVNAGPGILVAYATAPGSTTPDDGLFAGVLARELRISGRKASFAMFSAVEAVARTRPHEGQPFISPGGLPDWLCFNGCERTTRTQDEMYWLDVTANSKADQICDGYRSYLDNFPEGDYSERAHQLLSASECSGLLSSMKKTQDTGVHGILADLVSIEPANPSIEVQTWSLIQKANTAEGYERFLSLYPSGDLAISARRMLASMNQPARSAIVQQIEDSAAPLFELQRPAYIRALERNGKVFLLGYVDDAETRIRVESLAWSIEEVTEVLNDIVVLPMAPEKIQYDLFIESHVRAQLAEHNMPELSVGVSRGFVYIVGDSEVWKDNSFLSEIVDSILGATGLESDVGLLTTAERRIQFRYPN